MFKELFAKELADRSPVARQSLATKLLALSADSDGVPADQFVLLIGAYDAAREASELATCARAADTLAETYDVDGLRLKSDAAIKMALRSPIAATTNQNCQTALSVIDELVTVEDYTTAARVLSAARPAANEAGLLADLQIRAKEIERLRISAENVAPFVARLKTTPNDPAANIMVGQYLCFSKRDWSRGLPLLAQYGDSATKVAAALDLASPAEINKQVEAGDAWWAVGEHEIGPNQTAIRRRAAIWYDRASKSGQLAGLSRVKVEQRLAVAASAAAAPSPPSVANVSGPQRVLWFRSNAAEGAPFEAIAANAVKTVKNDDISRLIATPDAYANVTIVVWGINRWRETPTTAFTEPVRESLKQFVTNGGDLVMYEQFSRGNMAIIDALFGIKTSDAGSGAKPMVPELAIRFRDAGLTADVVKDAHFFNSYSNLPKGAIALVHDDKDRTTIAVVPFGKGRLVLIGTNTDPGQIRIVEEVLDLIYHYKRNKPQ